MSLSKTGAASTLKSSIYNALYARSKQEGVRNKREQKHVILCSMCATRSQLIIGTWGDLVWKCLSMICTPHIEIRGQARTMCGDISCASWYFLISSLWTLDRFQSICSCASFSSSSTGDRQIRTITEPRLILIRWYQVCTLMTSRLKRFKTVFKFKLV